MTFDEIRDIALSFPGTEEHRTNAVRVGKRLLTCTAKIDPDTALIKVPDAHEREYWLSTHPDVYYLTDHYASFECILVRMSLAKPDDVRDLIEQAWRAYAPKKLVAHYQTPE